MIQIKGEHPINLIERFTYWMLEKGTPLKKKLYHFPILLCLTIL